MYDGACLDILMEHQKPFASVRRYEPKRDLDTRRAQVKDTGAPKIETHGLWRFRPVFRDRSRDCARELGV